MLRFGVPLFDEAERATSLDLRADTITNPPRWPTPTSRSTGPGGPV